MELIIFQRKSLLVVNEREVSSAAVRLYNCKWRIMLLLSRSPNGCALVR